MQSVVTMKNSNKNSKVQKSLSKPVNSVKKRTGRPQKGSEFPSDTIKKAVEIATALRKINANGPSSILQLAARMETGPRTDAFRRLMSSAYKYELIDRSWTKKAETLVSITDLGRTIVAPGGKGDDPMAGMITAFKTPRVFAKFLESVGSQLPPDDRCENILINDQGLNERCAKKCYKIILDSLYELGVILELNNERYIDWDNRGAASVQSEERTETQPTADEPSVSSVPTTVQHTGKLLPQKVFIAHGKNKTELEQLKQLLKVVNITPIVAKDEPHAGMTISRKIPALMKECVAGIFIFTADEKVTDGEDKDVWRPSQNVIFELGLSIGLYGGKIIICKEKSLNMASNFSDFGYTSFEKGNLIAEAAAVLTELKKALGNEAVKLT